MLSWRDLPERRFSRQPALDEKVTGQYSSQIFELLQQRKRRELSQLLSELRDRLAGTYIGIFEFANWRENDIITRLPGKKERNRT